MEEVRDWLNDIGLGQYAEIFENQGWDDLKDVSEMEEEDIKTCIKKPGHIHKAKRNISSLRERFHRESRTLTGAQVDDSSEIKPRHNQADLFRQSDDTAPRSLESITRDDATVAKGPAGEICLKTKADEEPPTQSDLTEDMRGLPATDMSDYTTMQLAEVSKAIGNVAQSITPKLDLQTREAEGLGDDTATCSLENITRDYSIGAKDQAGDTFLKTKADEEPPTQSDLTEEIRGSPATNISDDATVQLAEESMAIESVAQSITPSKLDLIPVREIEEELQTEDNDTSTDDESETTERALIVSQNQSVATLRQSYATMSVSSSTIVKDSKNITIAEKIEMKNIHQVKSRNDNFTGQIRTAVRHYKKKEPLFVKTRAYTEVCDILDDRHWAVIVGNAGDGKSTMVHHLLLEHLNNGYEPVIVTSTDDWKILVEGKAKHSNKQFVIIDNMFGVLGTDEHKLNEWMALLDLAENVVNERKGELKVACTTRKYIWSEISVRVSRFKCMKSIRVVDLTHWNFLLSNAEKSNMLETYFMFHDVEKPCSFNQIPFITPLAHGFPHCVEIFCTNSIIREQGISFFETPVECIKKEMESMKCKDKAKMCALILTLLSKETNVEIESICCEETQLADHFKQAVSLAGLPVNTGQGEIADEFYNLKNVYLEEIEDGMFTFKHNSFKEMLIVVLTNQYPRKIIELLDIQFVVDHINYYDYVPAANEIVAVLPHRDAVINSLICRLTKEIRILGGVLVCKHQAWKNEDFVKRWLAHVTEETSKESDEESLLLKCIVDEAKHLTLHSGLLTWFAVYKRATAVFSIVDCSYLSQYWKTEDGRLHLSTALVYACFAGCSIAVLNKLIDHGADIETNLEYDINYFKGHAANFSIYTLLYDSINDMIDDGFCSPLTCSIFSGYVKSVQLLLKKGASVFQFSFRGKSIVFLAAERNSPEVLSCILDHLDSPKSFRYIWGKCPAMFYLVDQRYSSYMCNLRAKLDPYHKRVWMSNSIFSSELCPIHIASNVEILDILYSRGASANVNVKILDYTIPDIMYSAYINRITSSVIETMAKHGTDIKAECQNENTLHVICQYGYFDLYELVSALLKHGVDINAKDNNGQTPLAVMLYSEGYEDCFHANTVRLLISKGTDINLTDQFGCLPLFYAFQKSNLDICHELIECTEKPCMITNDGRNCFHFLAENPFATQSPEKLRECMNTMLNKGAEINYLNNKGYCPMSEAGLEMMKIYIGFGAQVNTLDMEGRTFVMKLLCRKTKDICKKITLLCENGTDLSQTDNEHRNAIHYLVAADCSASKKLDILDILLKEQCDINACDINHITPLMLALESKHCNKEFIAALTEKGACITKTDLSGNSVLCYLSRNPLNDPEIVELYEMLITQLTDDTKQYTNARRTFYDLCIKDILKSEKRDELKSTLLSLAIHDISCEYVTRELKMDPDLSKLILRLPLCVDTLIRHGIHICNIFTEIIDIALLPETDNETVKVFDLMLRQNINIGKLFYCSNRNSPALQLANDRKLKSLRCLLESGYNCTDVQFHTDYNHNTILHCLCSDRSDDGEVLDILNKLPINIYARTINKKGATPLIIACQQNNLKPQCISLLLNTGVDVNVKDLDGMSAIHYLAKNIESSCEEVTRYQVVYILVDLLDKHADLDIQDDDGRTALMYLFMSSNIFQFEEVIEVFISNSKKLDQRDNKGLTAIQYCNMSSLGNKAKLNIANKILQKGLPQTYGYTTCSTMPLISDLVLSSITRDKSQNQDNIFEYIHTCEHDQQEPDAFLHLVTTTGIDVNCDTDISGVTLLGQCCRYLCHELVEALLDHGANPNVPDCMGLVPLQRLLFSKELSLSNILRCVCFGDTVISQWIICKNSNSFFTCEVDIDKFISEFFMVDTMSVNTPTRGQFRHCLYRQSFRALPVDFVNLFSGQKEQYLDIKMKYYLGCLENFNEILKILHLLLTHQADPNKMDIFGKSPLHYCVESPTADGFTCLAMEMLLAHGADVNLEDFEGRTPLMLCAQYAGTKYTRMNILIRAGAKLNAVDYSGRDVAHYSRLGIAMMARNKYEEEMYIAEDPTLSCLVLREPKKYIQMSEIINKRSQEKQKQ